MQSIAEIIKEFRNKKIEGKLITFVPLNENYFESIVSLRNREKNKYFLNQNSDLTVESQANWYREYLKRNNDIYWCVFNKNGDFIGTNRIYDIANDRSVAEQGSFMVAEEFANQAPLALESYLMSLDFAFDTICAQKIINDNRKDNSVMNNLSKSFGFEYQGPNYLNGIEYNYYYLFKEKYQQKSKKVRELIEYWSQR